MAIQAIGQKYLRFFFLLGQSAYNPYYNPIKWSANNKVTLKRRFVHFLQFVPSSVYIVFVSISCPLYWAFFVNGKFSFNHFVYIIFTLSKLITCIMVFTCSPYFKNNLNHLWLKYQQLEHYASRRLNITWSFDQCIKSYQHKVFWMIILLIFRIISKFIFRNTRQSIYTTFSYALVAATIIAHLHILFYIDFYVFMLRTINKHLSMSHANRLFLIDSKIDITNIGFYKCLHYKCWQIAMAINSCFGWVLVSILVQAMSNILSPVYWIVVDFFENDFTNNNLQVISMFSFINLI